MLVCHCWAVNDKQIRREILDGASGVDEVGERCGAGTSCGGCRVAIERLLFVHTPSGVLAA
ncbi:MAG: (2Fe-2S)-binding protein [Acidimicrobiia bacterium]|nr:(2Fe-2S)-binding protein [Acidimicrobiia bacterium]